MLEKFEGKSSSKQRGVFATALTMTILAASLSIGFNIEAASEEPQPEALARNSALKVVKAKPSEFIEIETGRGSLKLAKVAAVEETISVSLSGDKAQGSIDFSKVDNIFSSATFRIDMEEPRELTDEEIIQGIERVWISRVEGTLQRQSATDSTGSTQLVFTGPTKEAVS